MWLRTSRIRSYQNRKDEEDSKTMEITRQYDVMYATEQTQQLWLGVSQAIHCSTPRQPHCRRKTTQMALHVCTSSTSEDEPMYKLNLEPKREHATLYSKAPRIGLTTLSSTMHSGKHSLKQSSRDGVLYNSRVKRTAFRKATRSGKGLPYNNELMELRSAKLPLCR